MANNLRMSALLLNAVQRMLSNYHTVRHLTARGWHHSGMRGPRFSDCLVLQSRQIVEFGPSYY
jgi:hypothetical protein